MTAALAKAWAQLCHAGSRGRTPAWQRDHLASMTRTAERRLVVAVSIVLLLILAAILVAIIQLCGGHLIYSLDDPYISLSLGWHIGHGHYGINAGEAASPASSVLYPFLLAAFAWTSWQEWVPLVANALAAVGTGAAFAAAICRYGIVTRGSQVARATVLIVTLCIAIDTIGLVFVGLEHSLHALTSVLVVLGMARALEEDRVPPWLLAAIVLLPLWRFEGCALALLAILALALSGQARAASIALCAVAASLGTYAAAMHALGLPLLPSSVLSKSAIAKDVVEGSAGPVVLLRQIAHNLWSSLNPQALPVFVLIALALARPALRAWRSDEAGTEAWSLWRETLFAGVVAGALIAHILFGSWGGFVRYAPYAIAAGAAGAIVLWRHSIATFFARAEPLFDAAGVLAMLCAGQVYLAATILTPVAARGVYEQQYQMHRFAADIYRRAVAVQDLGWVSYRNPNYVLDVWGLGSEEARRARARERTDPEAIVRLVQRRHIDLVMANDLTGRVPPDWCLVGELRTPHYIAAELTTLGFYTTTPDAVEYAVASLHRLARELISGTTLTIFDNRAPDGRACQTR